MHLHFTKKALFTAIQKENLESKASDARMKILNLLIEFNTLHFLTQKLK